MKFGNTGNHSPALETEGKGENPLETDECPVPVAEQVGYMCSAEIKSALGQGVILSPLWLEFRFYSDSWYPKRKVAFPPHHLLPVYPEINVKGSCLVKQWDIKG